MSIAVITPPSGIVSLDLAKKQCRVDDTDSDDLISAYLAAAQANIDGPYGWLGRALGVQTLELRLESFQPSNWCVGGYWAWDDDFMGDPGWGWDCWPFGEIKLPCPPLISIVSITYEDSSGADQTLTPEGWKLGDDEVSPVFGMAWPSGRVEANAVRIQYTAGYAPLPPATDGGDPIITLPPAVTPAILMMVADMWANREAQVIDTRAAVIENPTVANLLAPLRIWSP